MNTYLRSILAVAFGVLMIGLLDQFLEASLVGAVAGAKIANMDTYFAIRNEPQILGAKVVYTAVIGVLAGYMTAKIAAREEMPHAFIVALVVAAQYLWAFTQTEFAPYTPGWAKVVLPFAAGAAVLAGGWVRWRAAQVIGTDTTPVNSATKEQS
jgi:hypothetical protein